MCACAPERSARRRSSVNGCVPLEHLSGRAGLLARALRGLRTCDECAFHSAGSSGDLPDLHGFQSPSTLSLLLDTVVGWRSGARRLARPSAKRIRRTTGPDPTETLPSAGCDWPRAMLGGAGQQRRREGAETQMTQLLTERAQGGRPRGIDDARRSCGAVPPCAWPGVAWRRHGWSTCQAPKPKPARGYPCGCARAKSRQCTVPVGTAAARGCFACEEAWSRLLCELCVYSCRVPW